MLKDKAPKVSVVTPAFNQGEFLRETIDSVLSQDYPNIEYIVLNDGSTDHTPKILESYGDAIRWENQPNMGQTPTINKGWRMSKGEIVTWLNSDDTFLPGAVSTAVDYLRANSEAGIVFGDTMMTTSAGEPLGKSAPQPPFSYFNFVVNCKNTVSQPSAYIRRDVIDKVGYLDDRFYYFMDWDLWMRAGLHFEIHHIDPVMSTYRLHDQSKTVAQSAKAAPELEYMYNKYFERNDLPAEILEAKSEAMMNMYFTSGAYYLKGGAVDDAAKMGREALRVKPGAVLRPSKLSSYLYCRFGDTELYKKGRELFGRA